VAEYPIEGDFIGSSLPTTLSAHWDQELKRAAFRPPSSGVLVHQTKLGLNLAEGCYLLLPVQLVLEHEGCYLLLPVQLVLERVYRGWDTTCQGCQNICPSRVCRINWLVYLTPELSMFPLSGRATERGFLSIWSLKPPHSVLNSDSPLTEP